jgi:flagellar hook protein FlgE
MFNGPKVSAPAAVWPGMDKIAGTLQTALSGIDRSARRLDRAAQDVASASVRRSEPVDLVDPLVRALEAQRALEASAKVVERTDKMLGTLLDTFV